LPAPTGGSGGLTLAVVRLDRLGRSLAELLATVTMLKERGIALLSLEENIDTSSAAGELVFHAFGAIAHFERRLIAERTKDGIAATHVRGKRSGREPLDADRIGAALKLVAAGLSPTAAAHQIGLAPSIGKSVGQAFAVYNCHVPATFMHRVVYLTTDAMPSVGWSEARVPAVRPLPEFGAH
jgi:DNA invertase Pin-like site-specific DNA recombinase